MKSVLIVEDDEAMLIALRDNFESRGFEVATANNGTTALSAALRNQADLILLDLMLPELNGYEICRRVRNEGLKTPILMLTAKGQEEDIVRGLQLGADDFVTKPFGIRELLARVDAILRRSTNEDEIIRFGQCELDLAAHRLSRDGQTVSLTSKEFQLLALFADRPGRALTRHEILARVWGQSVVVTARSVDRCVTTLRAKIESDPRNPAYITTIRDIGYRFEIP